MGTETLNIHFYNEGGHLVKIKTESHLDTLFLPPSSLCLSLSLLSQDENGVVLSLGVESQRVIVSAQPFRLDIMEGHEVLMSLNSRGLLAFEHLRMRKDT